MNDENPEIQKLQTQCDEYLAGWKRAQADYANLKKDVERERGELAKYANERLLHELLPAVDQFETAMSFAPDISTLPAEDAKRLRQWMAGLEAVQQLWQAAFSSINLVRVPCEGAFDPRVHEAVGEEVSEGHEPGTILRCVQSGWILSGKLLRPARVVVVAVGLNASPPKYS